MNLKFLVTRGIYENKDISQRDLARYLGVSLGKINQIMKELETDNLIEKKVNYTVTKKGISLLKEHKVDGALILACGMGLRLAPLTYDTPKSFIKINGERMIERQIEQLKSVNINDITIMVGYLKERFDYLIDKYNVKLLYNEEYKEKNTLATLYHATDIIKNKNMYVCVSDVYIKENIYHEFECEPYYTGAFYEDCKGEWRYITNKKNEIKGVELGGTNDYCLVGPCFFKKDFSKGLLKLIDTYYHKSSTDNFYWEDVLVNNLDKLDTIYVYKHDKGVIFEFDTLKDIKDFDKNIKEYGSNALSFVADALKIKENDIKDIECIKEGMTNKSYRFSCKGIKYIARIPGEGTYKFIDRDREYKVYKEMGCLDGSSDISEEVLYFDRKTGYKIAKLFDKARILDINNDKELKDAMGLYAKFHTSGYKVNSSIDMIDVINQYLKEIKDKNIVVPYEDFDSVIKNIKELFTFIKKLDRPITLCHGDAQQGNVLYTDSGMKLIDFEYAGMADPISDIALFGTFAGFDTEKTYLLYNYYKEAFAKLKVQNTLKNVIIKDDALAKKLLVAYMSLSGLWSTLWAIFMEYYSAIDYGTYGMRMYRVCKDCYKYYKTL